MTAHDRLIARLYADMDNYQEQITRERREYWWPHGIVAHTPTVPEGATLAGWDTVLATNDQERAAATALFQERTRTHVEILYPEEAWEMGLRSENADWVSYDDDAGGDYPCVVAGLRWEPPQNGDARQ